MVSRVDSAARFSNLDGSKRTRDSSIVVVIELNMVVKKSRGTVLSVTVKLLPNAFFIIPNIF